ncbi:hypothetical protein [Cupriavidus sp. UME77]|uniref:hypothetical protein n=1 Tax=Cupriavidus sp. UME77 TaxID=1862321 RepID=UPI001DABC4E0|nr:hypothetical protein [Cupriavidus sp. UME77]MBB1635618.1 hypothetical protein [Cupriavidus sp. UME77]
MWAARLAAHCLLLAAATTPLHARAAEESESQPPAAQAPTWSGAVSAYLNLPRSSDAYVTGIAIANRGALHLEARSNYEGKDAYSFFAGYNLSAGEAVRLDVTPILGAVTGSTNSVVPGFEAAVTGRYADAYVEFEYVPNAKPSSYTYAWTELAFRPVDWFRIGFAGQRTRVYENGRDLQRGVFAQVKGKRISAAVYCFNPASHEQVIVISSAFSF